MTQKIKEEVTKNPYKNIVNNLEKKDAQKFEDKLKQAIIDRLEEKEKFVKNCDINELVASLKETKMSIENELEDLQQIKLEIQDLNKYTKDHSEKLEKRMNFIQNRLHKMKRLYQQS